MGLGQCIVFDLHWSLFLCVLSRA